MDNRNQKRAKTIRNRFKFAMVQEFGPGALDVVGRFEQVDRKNPDRACKIWDAIEKRLIEKYGAK